MVGRHGGQGRQLLWAIIGVHSDTENLDKAALGALQSMEDKEYLSLLLDMEASKILTYGASFRLKKCKVVQGERTINQIK